MNQAEGSLIRLCRSNAVVYTPCHKSHLIIIIMILIIIIIIIKIKQLNLLNYIERKLVVLLSSTEVK